MGSWLGMDGWVWVGRGVVWVGVVREARRDRQ